jgi:hypothetical protein
MDYVLGAAWDGEGYSADISANWLTYPGEATIDSLELSGSLSLDRSFAPTLAGFYDTRFEDWGLEISAGPEWEWRTWILYAVGRAGFVAPGDGSASRSYGGLELGAARPLSERATVGLYTRAEWADEDAFVRRTGGGSVTGTGSRGVSAGIILSLAH